MLITKAIFERKISEFNTQNCVIEGIELMNGKEFEEFSNNLLEDREFIVDRKEEMYIDSIGQIHGLLALNMESGDGILIDSQGHKYARYTAFMPNIKPYIEQQISIVAEQIIREAAANTSNGSWAFYFDEIEEFHGLVVKENNGIGTLLLDVLTSSAEIAEIEVLDECFDMTIYLDYCCNLDEEIKLSHNMENRKDERMDNIEKTIRILKIKPQKLPYEKEITNDLEGIQGEVEGLFECVYLDDKCVLVCNEEGKLNGMELNRRVSNDIIAGPFFIVGDSEDGEFVSLSDEQIEQYTNEFGQIQEFTGKELEAQPRMEFIGFDF